MAFLNDLSKKLTEVAGDAAEKAKDVAGIARLKTEIMGEQKKLQQSYAELGKLYYESVKDKDDGPEAVICAEIKDTILLIEDLESKIELIKND